MLCVTTAVLLLTPVGVALGVRGLAILMGARCSLGHIDGSLLGGSRLADVAIVHSWRPLGSIRFTAQQIRIRGLASRERWPFVHASGARLQTAEGGSLASAAVFAWSPRDGLLLRGVTLHEPARLAALFRESRASRWVTLPNVEIDEGVLQLPESAPVRFKAELRRRFLTASAYSERVSVRGALSLIDPASSRPSGWVEAAALSVDGPIDALVATGTMQVTRVSIGERAIRDSRGAARFELTRTGGSWDVTGTLLCEGGWVIGPRAGALLNNIVVQWPEGDEGARYHARLEEVQFDGIAKRPTALISVQRMLIRGQLAAPTAMLPTTVEVFNGRMWLPRSDPVFFSGGYQAGAWDLRFYTSTLNLQDLLTLTAGEKRRSWTGTLREVAGAAQGPQGAPEFTGQFRLERLSTRLLTVAEGPGLFRFRVALDRLPPQVEGEVAVNHGTVQLRHATLALQPSRLVFTGDPSRPELQAVATTSVEGTRIRIATAGFLPKPDLQLTSDPSMSERRLLLMVATGKAWRLPEEAAATEGWLPSNLVTDALDFFVLGGSASRLAQAFGISETSLQYNPALNRLGATATIADRIEFEVETDAATPQDRLTASPGSTSESSVPVTAYKIGAAYKLTESTSLGVEHGREPIAYRGGSADGAGTQGVTAPDSEETVFLKLKRRF
jgi:hypothetical protein